LKNRKLLFSLILIIFAISLTPLSFTTTTTRGDLLTNFIVNCHTKEGGFSLYPDNNLPDMQSTYYAVVILKTLGKLSIFDRTKIATWINSTQNIDGGFPNIENDSSTVESTYYAVKSLKLLGFEPKNNITAWLNQCWNSDYGFSNFPNESSSILSSYFALETLNLLNINLGQYNTSQWLIMRQNNQSEDNYGAFSSENGTYNLLTMYFALEALNLTGSINQINKTSAYNWIVSCQNTNIFEIDKYGSFSSSPKTLDFSVINCYSATYSLDILNDAMPLKLNVISWVQNCQNLLDGGFKTNTNGQSSSISSTYFAIETLRNLEGLGFLSLATSTGQVFYLSIWWIILFILIGIFAAYYIKKKFY